MTRNGVKGYPRVGDAVLTALSSFPFAQVAGSREPTVLLYHGIPRVASDGEIDAGVFESHIRFLTSRFEVVATGSEGPRKALEKQRVVITFDDGFRNNAEVAAPILKRYNAPADFFVCSRHAIEGEFLWVSYINALSRFYKWPELVFRGERFDMRPAGRHESVERLRLALRNERPHPEATYTAIQNELPALVDFVPAETVADRYAGMSREQIGELAADPLFTVGAHTIDHPFLSDCETSEMHRQVESNVRWIESATGTPCNSIAYPSGDYDARVLKKCGDLGFSVGYAVTPQLGVNSRLEVPRVGVYARSEAVLGFKVQWGNHLRAARISVG